MKCKTMVWKGGGGYLAAAWDKEGHCECIASPMTGMKVARAEAMRLLFARVDSL